jgi:hypothetical protein
MRWEGPAFGRLQCIRILFFDIERGRMLILLQLRRGDLRPGGQNIDSQRAAAKIFWNKDLAAEVGLGNREAPDWSRSGRTIPV